MHQAERQQVILKLVAKHGLVDVLNVLFVDAYVEATQAKIVPMPFGANKCKQLGSDLSVMFKCGMLDRSRIGLRAMEPGFPKWVFVYELKKG